ncbi:hypothetical protein Mapa_002571 [Marchantia paleacea]|nr:hypothetical protein Mapa_002571 [Marchantia paleacea]
METLISRLTHSFRHCAAGYSCYKAFSISCVFKRHLCKRTRRVKFTPSMIWSCGRLQNCTFTYARISIPNSKVSPTRTKPLKYE